MVFLFKILLIYLLFIYICIIIYYIYILLYFINFKEIFMRKLLSILSAVSLTGVISSSAVACNKPAKQEGSVSVLISCPEEVHGD
jgi:uncharacterized membrane protein